MATWVSARTGQFAYFDHQFGSPDRTGKRVLDFGLDVAWLLAWAEQTTDARKGAGRR